MKRENRKSIEANLRNKLAAQYKEKSDNPQKHLDHLDKTYDKYDFDRIISWQEEEPFTA